MVGNVNCRFICIFQLWHISPFHAIPVGVWPVTETHKHLSDVVQHSISCCLFIGPYAMLFSTPLCLVLVPIGIFCITGSFSVLLEAGCTVAQSGTGSGPHERHGGCMCVSLRDASFSGSACSLSKDMLLSIEFFSITTHRASVKSFVI